MNARAASVEHPRIAVLGSPGHFTARAVSALCEAGVPPVALMIGAPGFPSVPGVHGPSVSGVRGPIRVEVRDTAACIAVAHGSALVRVRHPNRPEAVAALERHDPDLLLIACLPYIVGAATRRTARLGALNLHPSALPRFRGPDPVFWQMRAGVERAGVTVHVATDAVDAGPIVAQRWMEVRPGISAEALTAALVRDGVQALVDSLPGIERRIREARPQDAAAATWQSRPRREDFRIDTSWRAERAYRFIEGVRGPGTTFLIAGAEGEIEVERATGFDASAPPGGAVIRQHAETVTIRFAAGTLEAVPARPRQASAASVSSKPNVDMSRMRKG